MARELVVAAVQLTSVDDVDTNLMQIESLLEQIFEKGQPRLVCFPENCLYYRVNEGEKIEGMSLQHPALARIAELAKQYSSYLHLGSLPLYLEGHLYNSSMLATPEGEVHPTYQKLHLFDIQLEGHKPIRESDVFRHGQNTSHFEVDGWKIGESICYDLRFAELFSRYARQEIDAILIPAAFLVKTGIAHWEVLLRARAIESQAYVIASAQAGLHKGVKAGTRETYGNTLVVDPWGTIAGHVDKMAPGYSLVTLSREKVDGVRAQIPMKFHRRLPIA